MPRAKRLKLPGVVLRVKRGNDRQACFFEAADFLRYPQDLREATLWRARQMYSYARAWGMPAGSSRGGRGVRPGQMG